MDDKFERCFNNLLELEGGYVNDPKDSGGATRYGITEKVAREHNYEGDMRDLPIEVAKEIYFKDYWSVLRLSSLFSSILRNELFEACVNVGTKRVAKWFQECVNLFITNEDKLLVVDEKIGQKTIDAANDVCMDDSALNLVRAINCEQGHHYKIICEKYPKNKKFAKGWYGRRITL